jgi:CheY-like chemotaxis protein
MMKKRTVLIVDDDQNVREILKFGVENFCPDCDVEVAANGLSALRVLENETRFFDLILTDNNMPGMTGLELAHQARNLQPKAHIVLMSGAAYTTEFRQKIRAARLNAFLQKPVPLPQIREILQKI